MADVTNCWVAVDEVTDLTGATATEAEILIAQTVIEGAINRVHRDTDAAGRDYYWLKRAVAWQAKFVGEHAEAFGLPAGLVSISQDGFSASYDTSSGNVTGNTVAPVAMSMLNNLTQGANTSLRLNSAFQGSGRRRRGGSGWRRL